MKSGFSVEDNITNNLKAMVNRANSVSSYLNRNLFRQYQKMQIKRFETENQSETGQWQPITPVYAARKRKNAKKHGWPGGGNVIMIASGKLKDGATAKDSALYTKMVTNTSFTISVNTATIPYAMYPGKQRPYMEFSSETEDYFMFGLTEFITEGKAMSA